MQNVGTTFITSTATETLQEKYDIPIGDAPTRNCKALSAIDRSGWEMVTTDLGVGTTPTTQNGFSLKAQTRALMFAHA